MGCALLSNVLLTCLNPLVSQIRIDKATQMTVDALAEWASSTRQCAAALGKHNFFIPGEITGGNTFGSIYL